MPELKPGWKRVKFGEVVRLSKERSTDPLAEGIKRYVGLEHIEPGDLRIRSWGDVADGTTFTSRFHADQVLFGKRRAYQRKVAVADFDGVCSGDIYVLESADPSRLLPELLPFICQTDAFFEHAVGTSAGSLSPRTNWPSLAAHEFALPPLDEQQKTAKALTSARSSAEQFEELVHATTALLSALRENLTEKPQFKSVQLGDLARMQNGRPFPSTEYGSEGVRLLRPANLHVSGTLDWRRERTVFVPSKYVTEAAGYIINPGDLVINLTAQSLEDGFMGRVCLASNGDRCLLNQRIGRILTHEDQLLVEYLYRVMQGARFQAHAIAMCEGTKVKHLFWHHLERFLFPLPPVDYQREACAQLNAADNARDHAKRRAAESQHMLHILLNSTLG